MELQLLLGGSGYGKSYHMYRHVIEQSLKYPEKNYFIIVPEQYTMQIQKMIVMMHPDHATGNIDVVSFDRLAYRIFDELGMAQMTILDDIGKSMVLRRVIGGMIQDLKVFGGNVQKTGFISEVKSGISEFLQYHIEPKQLEAVTENLSNRPILSGKLKDLSRIYEGFLEYISEKYMTTEGILDRLTQVVSESKKIAGSEFYLDEFTGFTPSQYDLLKELLQYGQGMQIALTVDVREDIYHPGKPYQLFYITKETIDKLNHMCMQWQIEREDDIILKECQRFESGTDLAMLEKRLYRRGKLAKIWDDYDKHAHAAAYDEHMYVENTNMYTESHPTEVYTSCSDANMDSNNQDVDAYGNTANSLVMKDMHRKLSGQIFTSVMANPLDELKHISGTILKLCHEGLRYRDMAIVTGDLSVYGHIAEQVMQDAGIPYFIDSKRDVLANNLVEFLRAMLEMILQDFNYDATFRCLKTGLTDIAMSDIHRLENYILATGLRGMRMWSAPFVRKYKGMPEGELEYLNGVRLQVLGWFETVYKDITSAKTAGEYAAAMLSFMEIHHIEQQMSDLADTFEENHELALAREYRQIYKVIEDIFERMKDILKDETMSVRTYAQILDAGLAEAKVGIIPPGTDQIMIGDIRRSRLSQIKVLFFVGVNEGIVPSAVRDGGLITDRDKEVLADNQLQLAPTGQQDAYTERFYIYAMMTKPTDRLYVSFTKKDSSGRSLRPSSLIERLQKLFPEMNIEDVEAEDVLAVQQETLYGQTEIIRYLIDGFEQYKERKADKFWLDLYSWMREQPEYEQLLARLSKAAFFSHEDEQLSKDSVRALYGEVLAGSVTTLERYASCAYAHFLSYGMRLNERPKYQIAAPDLGILFHSAIELFSKRLSDSVYNWHDVPDELRDELADQCVRDVTADERQMILYDNFRNQFLIYRLKRMVKRTIWALQQQLKKGLFEPSDYELRFDIASDAKTLDFKLSEHEVMQLKGAIDRLDVYEDASDIYVKIIDYKSGAKQFDAAALYYGLQLQLVVYMEAAMDIKGKQSGGKRVIPAGILYYNINDPMIAEPSVSADDEENEETDHKILSALRMNGVVNSDAHVIELLDQSIVGQSEVIPVALNKDGSLSKKSSAVPTETFKHLFKFTSGKVRELGKNILDGHIEMNPYKMNQQGDGCQYCPYRPVCGFDETLDGFEYRKLQKLSKDSAWAEICRKGEDYEREVDK